MKRIMFSSAIVAVVIAIAVSAGSWPQIGMAQLVGVSVHAEKNRMVDRLRGCIS